ncbi:MAG: hypothetical protein ACLFST_06490 [Spirochaetia bacterium]
MKRIYRRLSFAVHPDLSPGDSVESLDFIRLNRDYEEAAFFLGKSTDGNNTTLETNFLDTFFDLLAVGYPSQAIKNSMYHKRWSRADRQFQLLNRDYSFTSLTEAVRALNETAPEGITAGKYFDFLHYLDKYYLSENKEILKLGLERRTKLILPVFQKYCPIIADFTRYLLEAVDQK